MDGQRTWAKSRLLDLAERLTSNGAELAELRASGVPEHRIESLYPFTFAEWESGIRDIAHDVEWEALSKESHEHLSCEQEVVHLLTHSWEGTIRPLSGELAQKWRTKEIAKAWASATDDRNPSLAPHILSFTVLLLEALSADRAHPAPGTTMLWLWNVHMRAFKQTVDELAWLMQTKDWKCKSQHTPVEGPRL